MLKGHTTLGHRASSPGFVLNQLSYLLCCAHELKKTLLYVKVMFEIYMASADFNHRFHTQMYTNLAHRKFIACKAFDSKECGHNDDYTITQFEVTITLLHDITIADCADE
jgi:hypothetical protein